MTIGKNDFRDTYFPKGEAPVKQGAKIVKTTKEAIEHAKKLRPSGEKSKDKINENLRERIKDDYKPDNPKPAKITLEDDFMPPPPTRIVRPPVKGEKALKAEAVASNIMPNSKKVSNPSPKAGKEVLNPISKKSGIANKQTKQNIKTHDETVLSHNPLMMKMRKKADYEGEIKQPPEDVKAEKEFAEKAGSLGYRFDTDFEMYLPIQKGTKDALTKEEMTAMIEGKLSKQAASKPREMKFEGRTAELDDFARKETFHFNEEMGMYVSSNPFSGDTLETIDEMKGRMTSLIGNKALDEAAKKQGFNPIPGMDGIYINDKGAVKAADEFR